MDTTQSPKILIIDDDPFITDMYVIKFKDEHFDVATAPNGKEGLKKIKEFEMPQWAYFIKTSVTRARPPFEPEFWYKRAAGILRQIYIRKIVGVNRLRTRYGGRQDRGMKPPHFREGSGKIIRVILQQAEKAGFTEKMKGGKGKKSGRKLTEKGNQWMNEIAASLGE